MQRLKCLDCQEQITCKTYDNYKTEARKMAKRESWDEYKKAAEAVTECKQFKERGRT